MGAPDVGMGHWIFEFIVGPLPQEGAFPMPTVYADVSHLIRGDSIIRCRHKLTVSWQAGAAALLLLNGELTQPEAVVDDDALKGRFWQS